MVSSSAEQVYGSLAIEERDPKGTGEVVSTTNRQDSEWPPGSSESACDFVGCSVTSDGDNHVVVVVEEVVGDVHRVANRFGFVQIYLEASGHKGRLKLWPAFGRYSISRLRVEYAGDARHECLRIGF
jgi:hypothetical protein